MTKLQELRQKLATHRARYKAWLTTADPGTDDYQAKVDDFESQLQKLAAQVRAAELEEDDDELDRRVRADAGVTDVQITSQISGGDRVIDSLDDHGFSSFGEFSTALIQAAHPHRPIIDDRLRITADAPGSTRVTGASGTEGGFLVPPSFSSRVRQYAVEEDSLLGYCNLDPIAGSSMSFPVDQTTPWGTSGVLAYWDGEGQSLTKSAISTEQRTMRLKKLTSLVPATSEMVEDATMLNSWLPRAMGRAIGWKTNDAIVNGSGAGLPLGFANPLNTALITQAKETSQTADTIVAGNVARMYGRNLSPQRAVWLCNPDAWQQIPLMTIGDQPVWTPPSEGAKRAPNGTLFGRPLLLTDCCQTVGDAGDIYFVDLQAYSVITKAGGISFAQSMHLWFDYDMMAFRAIFRIDGMPEFDSAVTPPNSSITRSPYVQLAART